MFVIADFEPAQMPELVTMWRASFEFALGLRDPHPLHEQVRFFENEVRPAHRVRVAVLQDGTIGGFMASSDDSLNQLYVRVGLHGQGIGSALLDIAKRESTGELTLFTFARNRLARLFYERRGFECIAHGFEPHWQLEDMQYRWRRDALTAPGPGGAAAAPASAPARAG